MPVVSSRWEYTCKSCGTMNYPYGRMQTKRIVPFDGHYVCSKCNLNQEVAWLDDETKKEYFRKKFVTGTNHDMSEINSLKQQVDSLKMEKDVLLKEIDLLKSKITSIEAQNKITDQILAKIEENEILTIKETASEHANDISDLLERVIHLEQELEFKKDNK